MSFSVRISGVTIGLSILNVDIYACSDISGNTNCTIANDGDATDIPRASFPIYVNVPDDTYSVKLVASNINNGEDSNGNLCSPSPLIIPLGNRPTPTPTATPTATPTPTPTSTPTPTPTDTPTPTPTQVVTQTPTPTLTPPVECNFDVEVIIVTNTPTPTPTPATPTPTPTPSDVILTSMQAQGPYQSCDNACSAYNSNPSFTTFYITTSNLNDLTSLQGTMYTQNIASYSFEASAGWYYHNSGYLFQIGTNGVADTTIFQCNENGSCNGGIIV